ncbi:coenzyme F420-reducing hydrogenase beta subunit [Desulfitobacterium sp. LBE]|uniref:Coenzyme F420 hydrogenase/dehydrogenase, beta subunit C-terminal domain n=1 Tax=Desulfitobacterium sp. LBE TaxID=884086 RepID=UPI00119AD2A7|nr:Coenzyme F420 hydrogenase/dehydrogenase, beta subunit C-terminal domain [Desulfitobacterium sp. LBE]TWH59748.1 coenzyme F420-reducing hydrogenase beta subunit [Desulfitobacterium sp. LBE]
MRVDEVNKTDCTGCRACEHICPKHCITMKADAEGFLYPFADESACINCGLCFQRCPQTFLTIPPNAFPAPLVYAAKLRDRTVLLKSSSGGIFTALAQSVLDRNGVVFGCVFDKGMHAIHTASQDIAGTYPMRGSKYVQSDTGDTYVQSKQLLDGGRIVLYTGCPCQIAGLRSYLGRDYPNLLAIDLVCHGAPSPKLFAKYLMWLEKKYKSKIFSYEFRHKGKNGWGMGLRVRMKKGEHIFVREPIAALDPYMSSFLEARTYRSSCYACHYATKKRTGDITAADYWGIERFHPEFYDACGVSLVLVNTSKGTELFKSISGKIESLNSTFENASNMNTNLYRSAQKPADRDLIYADIDILDFEAITRRYLRPSLPKITLILLKASVPRAMKKQIKKTLRFFTRRKDSL